MPRTKKKNVTETIISEQAESAVMLESAESKQAEEKLEEASFADLEKESEEQAVEKQKKPRAKRNTIKKEAEVKEMTGKRGSAKKEAAKKDEGKQIFIQYAGKEVTVATIEERVKKAWEAEGHRASSIKKLDIYIKPEEAAVYYVINGKSAGRVDF